MRIFSWNVGDINGGESGIWSRINNWLKLKWKSNNNNTLLRLNFHNYPPTSSQIYKPRSHFGRKRKLRSGFFKPSNTVSNQKSYQDLIRNALFLWKRFKLFNQIFLKELIPQFLKMIDQLKETPFESLRSLGKTLDRWKEEIVRMWRFRKTNSITEGLHNKMEVISRRSYGFRNFQNYRLRVKVLCA